MSLPYDIDQVNLIAALRNIFDLKILNLTVDFSSEPHLCIHATNANHDVINPSFRLADYKSQSKLTIAVIKAFDKAASSEEQLIIDNAPCDDWDAYHDGTYYKEGEYGVHHWECGKWSVNSDGNLGVVGRNRNDIQLIAELKKS